MDMVGKTNEKKLLEADFGASGGRVMAGLYDGNKIRLSQLHRFSNDPVFLGDTMHWDFLRLFHELKTGLKKAGLEGGADSIGVDTWGVDFGLIDAQGCLLENPVHYRDARTEGMLEEAFKCFPKDRFYELTGNQFMEINTAFQLLSLKKKRPALLERADKMLMMSDLFNYYLSGNACCEYTMASTTQLLNAEKKTWSKEVIDALGLPEKIFLPVTMPGTDLGLLQNSICRELDLKPLHVMAVAGHDTGCALAAVPTKQKDFIFVSCGTWSLFGTELDSPVINEKSVYYNVANEGGFAGKISFLKNIIGLWLIQESKRQWTREGKEFGFGELDEMASGIEKNRSFVDPDDAVFVPAGDVPGRIREYCLNSGQPVPETTAQIVRCIQESLALKYRVALEEIEDCTGKNYEAIHIVGGGTQSRLLCQLVANACKRPVYAGPVEATAYGNLAIQLSASGEISGLDEIRSLISASEDIMVYEPHNNDLWDEKYDVFCKIIAKGDR